MYNLRLLSTGVLLLVFLRPVLLPGQGISIEGATADTGFNVGSVATIRATLRGMSGDPSQYAVFAEIQYLGTTGAASVQMDRWPESKAAEFLYEAEWPIPLSAPTGIYSVTVRVEDRAEREEVASQQLRSLVVYKKLVRIARVTLDRTFYTVGEPIQCEVTLENLTDQDIADLRVEFSNANYPWISTVFPETGKQGEVPELELKVLRERMKLPAESRTTIPMMAAGTATFLQGTQVALLGIGGPARQEKIPPPEVNEYTVAVWNADRTVLYDMQFSPPAVIRAAERDRPIPYGRNFAHRYTSDIDFSKYRHFYPPEYISSALVVDHARTLFHPGENVRVKATLRNPEEESWSGAELRVAVLDSNRNQLHTATLLSGIDLAPGQTRNVEADAWKVPASSEPGDYSLRLTLLDSRGQRGAEITSEIAVNNTPKSLLVFCAHEDDELAYAGLIRAALEAGAPVRVVVLTAGDVGACERYYSKPCGPNEAREFGLVRMEETSQALEHIGLTRDKITFLGLPDGGLGAIWSRHLTSANPFLSIYLACDRAPYEHVLKPNLPYARDAVLEAIKQIVAEFRPALIATTHPDERHVDHRATGWFVIKACQELLREKKIDARLAILADQAYGAGGFKPAPYRYEKVTVFLSGEAAALKQEMSWIYQSQDGNLEEASRRTLAELPRQETHYRIVDWQQHPGWNE